MLRIVGYGFANLISRLRSTASKQSMPCCRKTAIIWREGVKRWGTASSADPPGLGSAPSSCSARTACSLPSLRSDHAGHARQPDVGCWGHSGAHLGREGPPTATTADCKTHRAARDSAVAPRPKEKGLSVGSSLLPRTSKLSKKSLRGPRQLSPSRQASSGMPAATSAGQGGGAPAQRRRVQGGEPAGPGVAELAGCAALEQVNRLGGVVRNQRFKKQGVGSSRGARACHGCVPRRLLGSRQAGRWGGAGRATRVYERQALKLARTPPLYRRRDWLTCCARRWWWAVPNAGTALPQSNSPNSSQMTIQMAGCKQPAFCPPAPTSWRQFTAALSPSLPELLPPSAALSSWAPTAAQRQHPINRHTPCQQRASTCLHPLRTAVARFKQAPRPARRRRRCCCCCCPRRTCGSRPTGCGRRLPPPPGWRT